MSSADPPKAWIGRSPTLAASVNQATNIAKAGGRTPIMICGETGTGKTLLGEEIARRAGISGPFVYRSCADISASLFESELFGHIKGAFTGATRASSGMCGTAQGGILFLDEIGEVPLDLQAKFLSFVERRQYTPVGSNRAQPLSALLIFATNADLADRVRQGRFRRDLYYRICNVTIKLPPLRERTSDIPLLVNHFLAQPVGANGRLLRVERSTLDALQRRRWPGNVRQLEHAIRNAVMTADPDCEVLSLLEIERYIDDSLSGPAPEAAQSEIGAFSTSLPRRRGMYNQLRCPSTALVAFLVEVYGNPAIDRGTVARLYVQRFRDGKAQPNYLAVVQEIERHLVDTPEFFNNLPLDVQKRLHLHMSQGVTGKSCATAALAACLGETP